VGGADCTTGASDGFAGPHWPWVRHNCLRGRRTEEESITVMMKLTPIADGADVPHRSASFDEKMAYYRSQHTTTGVRATHLVGIPAVAAALPLIAARPRVGVPLFLAGWSLQVLGHKVFEKNSPALTKGVFTYQFCGLAFWCEEMADLIAGRSPLIGRKDFRDLDDSGDIPGIPIGDSAQVN
jgi:hypothetical protein